jgi:predicted glycosyltransferase involved in capsule biosynthesis
VIAEKITLLTPLDLKRRPASLLSRIVKLAQVSGAAEFELMIGHADRGSVYDTRLKNAMQRHSHVRIVTQERVGALTNLALLRNIAAQAAGAGVLIFLDADIEPDVKLFRSLADQVHKGVPLAMAPCLYLSKRGTQALAQGTGLETIIQSALEYSPLNVTHWALPSSVMAVQHSDLVAAGGFFEGYSGHGYEDFDFMIRLALAKHLIKPSPSLLVDRTYRAPLLAEGFRAELGVLCLANLLQGNVAVHLFHGRDNEDVYYVQRNANAKLFRQRTAMLLELPPIDSPSRSLPTMITAFYEECRRQSIDPARFHALFDARPRHLLYPRSIGEKVLRGAKRAFRRWTGPAMQ